LSEQKKLTGNKKYIFLDRNGQRMTPDHFRNVVWTPALVKAEIAYRPPIQMRHTFATMMISAGEDIGWVQNMMGHSSLQMIYQRYYAWMDNATRTDGQAFLRHFENAGVKNPVSDKSRTNIVPLDDFRLKKGAGI
jgi:integrase